MHAVVTQVTIEDFDRARANLHENIVPTASQAPGFIAGYWTRLTDDRGIAIMVFEDEDAAKAAQEQVRSAPRVGATVADVQVAEVVAHA
jgi:hypothetical protein